MYDRLGSLEAMHVFMEHHVFAVWDFMSLLKALQNAVTGTNVPWSPSAKTRACRFVNEIVLGEESDEDRDGGYVSHFEMYRRAMKECGASTDCVDALVDQVVDRRPLRAALDSAKAPLPVRHFVCETFAMTERVHETAAAFTFGREDLLPAVFSKIVATLDETNPGRLGTFRYYLERHIDLDGDHHGPMSLSLVDELCGDDEAKWNAAGDAAVRALEARLVLWDGVCAAIDRNVARAS